MEQTELVEQKKSLRREMRSRIRLFCSDAHAEESASEAAVSAFLSSGVYRKAQTVLVFISTGEEVDTKRIVAASLNDGKKTAVPRTIKNTNEMDFYYLDGSRPPESQLAPGAYGILEPAESAEKVDTVAFPAKTVIVVPGLAFAADGCRLGKGKGFYDRYIGRLRDAAKNQPDALAGLCFKCQLVEKLPHNNLDMRVSHIVCESGLRIISPNLLSTV
jgi:5-formyltetrahydrofolate cyclo-ligase